MKADKNTVIIMRFPDVVVIEKLGTGAVYFYKPTVFDTHFKNEVNRIRDKENHPNKPGIKEVTHGHLRDPHFKDPYRKIAYTN
jgi:hypothetical protein